MAAILLLAACGSSSASKSTESEAWSSATVAADEDFADPQGTYTVRIGTDWVVATGTKHPDREAWAINGYGPLPSFVSIGTSTETYASVEEYMQRAQLPTGLPDLEVLSNSIVRSTSGDKLAVVEYTGTDTGTPVHIVVAIAVPPDGGTAVDYLFTAPAEQFDATYAVVHPLLLTLSATGNDL